jgi:uncharacterized protein (TIGR02147 family)
MISVYDFTDYRDYLRRWYEERKAANPAVSHRFIAERVGFRSAGHFSQVLSGKANISSRFIESFTTLLKLRKREAEYFHYLVLFGQAKTHEERQKHFEAMAGFRESTVRKVEAGQYEYYRRWWTTAVREALSLQPCHGDWAALGKLIQPEVPAEEVRHSVELLVRLGLARQDESGRYIAADQLLGIRTQTRTLQVETYVLNSLKLAAESIDRFGYGEKNHSWVAMTLSDEGFHQVVEELRAARQRILKIVEQDKHAPNRLWHMNMHLFPMSRVVVPKPAAKVAKASKAPEAGNSAPKRRVA